MNEILNTAEAIANAPDIPNEIRNWAGDIYEKVKADEQVPLTDLQVLGVISESPEYGFYLLDRMLKARHKNI